MKAKKKLLLALCIVVVLTATVAGSVLGTIAYLTSSAAVSNVFTVGNVQIVMDEGKVNRNGEFVNANGEVVTNSANATRVDTNTYHLVPGKQYNKDPQIRVNSGSEDSYLFVLVRNDLEGIGPKGTTQYLTIAEQMNELGWVKYTEASTGDVYIYCGDKETLGNSNVALPEKGSEAFNAIISARDNTTGVTTHPVFGAEGSNVTATLTKEDGVYNLFKYFYTDPANTDLSTYGAAKITLTAVAIQATGFEGALGSKESVDAAWAAVKAAYPYIHTGSNS